MQTPARLRSKKPENRAMKTPARLQTLMNEGLIDTVVRQLKSGKEADVYVVRCGGETCAAKIYKEANKRSFRQAVDYTENRKVRTAARRAPWPSARPSAANSRRPPGRAPRSTRCTVWPRPGCACRGPATSTTACC